MALLYVCDVQGCERTHASGAEAAMPMKMPPGWRRMLEREDVPAAEMRKMGGVPRGMIPGGGGFAIGGSRGGMMVIRSFLICDDPKHEVPKFKERDLAEDSDEMLGDDLV